MTATLYRKAAPPTAATMSADQDQCSTRSISKHTVLTAQLDASSISSDTLLRNDCQLLRGSVRDVNQRRFSRHL
ncbi:hypothetical protein [Rudaea sp.]|uniref:hypothetical protein n=1 Tax=Rudaea sp. TaxID=2136325 RepID=UPI002ED4B579